jgi:hypothetical protein
VKRNTLLTLVSTCILTVAGGPSQTARAQSTPPASPQRTILNRYCVTCHNERLKTAQLTLDKMDVENVPAGAPIWEKVINKLRTGAMPPASAPRPDKATYDSLATYLETALDRWAASMPNPGRPGVHRLNRTEYGNAIRDLLGLEIDAESLLPPDDSSYGFDNIGEVLSVSPSLLERYMSAARKVSSLAVGDPAIRPFTETFESPKHLTQDDRLSESLPFGSRGGMAIRHHFPVDGEYLFKIRLRRNVVREMIIGIAERHQLDLHIDGERVKSFTVGGGFKGKKESIYSDSYNAEEYMYNADAGLEIRIPVKAGTRDVGISFIGHTAEPEGPLQAPLSMETRVTILRVNAVDTPSVASVTIDGPYSVKGTGETPSRLKIFMCRPDGATNESSCARKILSTLARRAYRRPVTDGDIQTLLGFYETGRSKSGFEAGIRMAMQAILVSPEFLFRLERDPAKIAPSTAYRISDLELASRLSFFLWSSIPDDQLLDLAEHGRLKDPAVLEQQVRRMLADSRSKALMSNFAGQWLYLRNMRSVTPDPESFPDFDEELRQGLQQETELFMDSMVRDDRSVLDLLSANYTFLNERLARHYGIPNIYGSHFRRVTLSDENRRGLLGQGSILTVTSYATRTSPTLRGKWVLDNLLGAPPPPPPGNVPSLKDRGEDGRILSVRQQMEQHRANPACAGCHARMDPLGFAIDNFDAVGRWRTISGADNTPIDASGVLPDGTKFKGPAELRTILLSHPEQFVTTVSEKLLIYALGRGVEYYDEPAVRAIVRKSASTDYRWSSIILGIVNSTPFQMRRSRE